MCQLEDSSLDRQFNLNVEESIDSYQSVASVSKGMDLLYQNGSAQPCSSTLVVLKALHPVHFDYQLRLSECRKGEQSVRKLQEANKSIPTGIDIGYC